MNTIFKKRVGLSELNFWKSFMIVLVFYYIIKLIYMLIGLKLAGVSMSIEFFLAGFSSVFFSLFPLAPIASFIVTYFVMKSLINENPKKVFTSGLVKLSLIFLIFQIFLSLICLLVIDGELGYFVFSSIMYRFLPLPVLLVWLFLSTIWLYKSQKKLVNC